MKKFQETQQSIKALYKGSTSAVEGMRRYGSIYIYCRRIDSDFYPRDVQIELWEYLNLD